MLKWLLCGSLAVILQSLMSCGGDKKEAELDFSSYTLSGVYDGADSDSLRKVLENFDGRWSVKVNGVLPEHLGDKSVAELRDSLCRMANISINENGEMTVAYPKELRELSKELGDTIPADRRPGSTFENTLSISMLTPEIAVFNSYLRTYPEGAAHGAYLNSYVNYDIRGGKILRYSNIFTDGFGKMLVPAILNKLQEQGVELMEERENIRMPRQFRITSDGIDFIYNIYEVAPYSEGEPTAHFAFGELESIMRPEGKALLLGAGDE